MQTNLVWVTPDAERLLGHIARVSNPANQDNEKVEGLIKYMIKHQHWSPFEMVSACFAIKTTRDIGRQILRHRSFVFQEFSQRYATVDALADEIEYRECRMQDATNRQSSNPTDDATLLHGWEAMQRTVYMTAQNCYQDALKNGIAKEQARALLPEGLTPTSLYMSGTIRSWIHYCQLRTGAETQKEHRDVAQSISKELAVIVPTIWAAAGLA
jgi:thymidylate synthase (FAD)